MKAKCATELIVYKKGFDFAMRVFAITKCFPPEERFALTSQVRRSSRSVCLNLREAWAKRRYPAAFLNKLTDCDAELNESQSALDVAKECQYINPEEHHDLIGLSNEIGRMLGAMIDRSGEFTLRS